EERPEVRARGVEEERVPSDGEGVGDTGGLQGNVDRLHEDGGRPLRRGRIGELDVDHDASLVLLRDEALGEGLQAPPREAEEAGVEDEDERRDAEHLPDDGGVASRGEGEEGVEGLEDPPEEEVEGPLEGI